jgi:uncharacterized membrane protein
MRVYIKDIVTETYTNQAGYSLFVVLDNYFSTNTMVEVSFANADAFSSSFLNSSIGSLIEKHGQKKFKELFKPVEINKSQINMLVTYLSTFKATNNHK